MSPKQLLIKGSNLGLFDVRKNQELCDSIVPSYGCQSTNSRWRVRDTIFNISRMNNVTYLCVLSGFNSSELREQRIDSTKPIVKREFPAAWDSREGATAGIYKARKNKTDRRLMINGLQKESARISLKKRLKQSRLNTEITAVENSFEEYDLFLRHVLLAPYQPCNSTQLELDYCCGNTSILHQCVCLNLSSTTADKKRGNALIRCFALTRTRPPITRNAWIRGRPPHILTIFLGDKCLISAALPTLGLRRGEAIKRYCRIYYADLQQYVYWVSCFFAFLRWRGFKGFQC